MKNLIGKFMFLMLVIFATMGCPASVTFHYVETPPSDPASPGKNEFFFSLRDSKILISSTTGTGTKLGENKQAVDLGDAEAKDVCVTSKKANATSNSDDDSLECLLKVSALATPARDTSHIYTAKYDKGTAIQTTAVDSDPLLLKSITVNYTNPTKGIIGAAATGATTGYAFGPWGALAGGVVGTVGGIVKVYAALERVPKELQPMLNKVCDEDKKLGIARFISLNDDKGQPQLYVPVTVDFLSSHASITDCWHPLPNRSKIVQITAITKPNDPEPLSGWFYRFQHPGEINKDKQDKHKNSIPPILSGDATITVKPPFYESTDYFSQEFPNTFPVSACQPVELQITRWRMLKDQDPNKYRFPMIVADPDYVQAVAIPQNGTIYLSPNCGGYESPTQASSALGDVIDALVNAVQTVTKAQNDYKKNTSSGK